jgi:hypothetical protein
MVYSPSQHGALKSGGLFLVIKRLVVEAVSATFLDWCAMGDHDLSRVPSGRGRFQRRSGPVDTAHAGARCHGRIDRMVTRDTPWTSASSFSVGSLAAKAMAPVKMRSRRIR